MLRPRLGLNMAPMAILTPNLGLNMAQLRSQTGTCLGLNPHALNQALSRFLLKDVETRWGSYWCEFGKQIHVG